MSARHQPTCSQLNSEQTNNGAVAEEHCNLVNASRISLQPCDTVESLVIGVEVLEELPSAMVAKLPFLSCRQLTLASGKLRIVRVHNLRSISKKSRGTSWLQGKSISQEANPSRATSLRGLLLPT